MILYFILVQIEIYSVYPWTYRQIVNSAKNFLVNILYLNRAADIFLEVER